MQKIIGIKTNQSPDGSTVWRFTAPGYRGCAAMVIMRAMGRIARSYVILDTGYDSLTVRVIDPANCVLSIVETTVAILPPVPLFPPAVKANN